VENICLPELNELTPLFGKRIICHIYEFFHIFLVTFSLKILNYKGESYNIGLDNELSAFL
jgi:hypothetical protein